MMREMSTTNLLAISTKATLTTLAKTFLRKNNLINTCQQKGKTIFMLAHIFQNKMTETIDI